MTFTLGSTTPPTRSSSPTQARWEPLIVAGALGLLLILVALPSILFRKKDPLDKLRDMRLGSDVTDSAHALRRGGKDERLDRFAQYLEPQDQAEFSAAQLQLVRAGYRSKGAVQTFHFAQFALGIGGLSAWHASCS